ncbi:MAG: PKD domain-containing protein, partial [Ferruginibacter sp.]
MKNTFTFAVRQLKWLVILLFLMIRANFTFAQNCAVNAGLEQTICITQSMTLTGSPGAPQYAPASLLWTKLSGPAGTITSPTAATTTVTGFSAGVYVFELASKCADGLWARDNVTITVLPEPVTALAGNDVVVCSATAVTLAGNAVSSPYTGTWTSSPATGTFSNTHLATSTYTPTASSGVRKLYWTISNGSCSTVDSMNISVVAAPAVNAGVDKTLSCVGSTTTLAGSSPGLSPIQSGLWSLVSGPSTPTFSNSTLSNSTVSNLITGTYTLKWTVSGTCVNGNDNMVINVTNTNSAPNAGAANVSYTTFCSSPAVTSQVLNGQALTAGETAVWAQTGGGTAPYPNVTFTPDANTASVTVSGLTGTFPYTFTYTKTNTSGCTASRTHTIYRNPSITNLSEPSNVYLNCDSTRGTFNMTYSDLANITTGITRAGVFISGPTTGALAYSSSSASAGVRTDVWTATNMTLAELIFIELSIEMLA